MFSEPVQLKIVKRSFIQPGPTSWHRRRSSQSAVAVDEAFAELPVELMRDRRVDEPSTAGIGSPAPAEGNVVQQLANEVASLNRRYAQLSEMLRTIHTPASS
jgi:hypothetical protein